MTKSHLHLIISFIFCLALASCGDFDSSQSTASNSLEIIDIDSLIKSQVILLVDRKIEKEVTFSGQSEKLLLIADSVLLMGDLNVFSAINIRNPRFTGEYEMLNENGTLKFNRKGNVGPNQVRVVHSKKTSLTKIEASINESNFIFSSSRKYMLEVNQANKEITQYNFSGYQKILFKDTVFFDIRGKILPN